MPPVSTTTREEIFYPASHAARLAGVSPGRLRRYERAGLIRPTVHGRARLYSAAQLAEVRRIRRLHEVLGINLAGIDVILRLLRQIESLHARSAAVEGRGVVESPTAFPINGRRSQR
jgi:MerR family transcriptional regulator/heat shock protein HspR